MLFSSNFFFFENFLMGCPDRACHFLSVLLKFKSVSSIFTLVSGSLSVLHHPFYLVWLGDLKTLHFLLLTLIILTEVSFCHFTISFQTCRIWASEVVLVQNTDFLLLMFFFCKVIGHLVLFLWMTFCWHLNKTNFFPQKLRFVFLSEDFWDFKEGFLKVIFPIISP